MKKTDYEEIPLEELEIKAYCYFCLGIVDRRKPHYCIAETIEQQLPDGTTRWTRKRQT